MVDPNKLKDFLQRTASALQKSMDAGDAEGTQRYSAMLDRAVPLADKVASQPQPGMPGPAGPIGAQAAPQEQSQEQVPVIPWGAKPQPAPQAQPEAGPALPPPPWAVNPFKPQDKTSPMLTMPGGQDTPLGSKGSQGTGPEQVAGVKTETSKPTWRGVGFGGGMMEQEKLPVSKIGEALDAFGIGGKKKASPLDLPGSEKSKIPQEGAVETQEPYVKQNAGLPEPELMDVVQQVEANPYNDVEAEAIKRIKSELQDKPHPLMYLFTLLMMGAPRTFAMIMADQNRYSQGVRDIYNSVRQDKANWDRNKLSQGFREREVSSNEDRALAALARAENDKLRAAQGEQGKDLRTIMQAPIDPKDPLSQRAKELMMLRLPKQGQ